jgi:hypothetical protein
MLASGVIEEENFNKGYGFLVKFLANITNITLPFINLCEILHGRASASLFSAFDFNYFNLYLHLESEIRF